MFHRNTHVLPKHNDAESFPLLLAQVYKSFLDTLDKIDKGTSVTMIKDNRKIIEGFCDKLIQSANTYYEGFTAKAYFEFEEGMNLIDECLFPKEPVYGTIRSEESFFRARLGKNIQLRRKEMFHIPFENREYVTTQRFSVPGLPCLYLANSVYCCWEELRRPDINKMQVSKFKAHAFSLNFLDLSVTPATMAFMLEAAATRADKEVFEFSEEDLDKWSGMGINYLIKWPLIAACSIKVKKEDAAFKPEYIFPQFLLQWVTGNKNIDGVKYFSVEANIASKTEYGSLINFAIPVKEIANSGLCKKMTESFSLTEPISWEMLTMVDPNIIQPDEEKRKRVWTKLNSNSLITRLEFIKGKKMTYWYSVFGKIEIELAEMDFEKIV